MLTRYSAVVLVAICSVTLRADTTHQVIGAWQSDDGRGYAEIHFRPDHSCTLFNRPSLKNRELAVADMAEQSGTWQVGGDRMKFYLTRHWPKERWQRSVRFRVRNGVLSMQNVYDRTRTDMYSRLSLPPCAGIPAPTSRLREEDILGEWRGHYRTHDVQFVFESGNRATAYSEGIEIYHGTWRAAGRVITIEPHFKHDEGLNHRIVWTVLHQGQHCLTIGDGSSMSYVLQHLR